MTANTSETDESRRVIRMLERSIIKRDVAVNRLRSVMSLAQRSMKDPKESPHLLEAVEDLENLWSKFEVEDEAILDHLLSLERSSEYSAKLSAEMRELTTFCRSVARRYRESGNPPAIFRFVAGPMYLLCQIRVLRYQLYTTDNCSGHLITYSQLKSGLDLPFT
jgi:hypothetical protein